MEINKIFQKTLSIEDFDLMDKKVFLRLDLNVPMKDGKILNDNRIQTALPTIKYALEKGAKLIIASHLGRPDIKNGLKEESRKKFSLEPIAAYLGKLLDIEVFLVEDLRGEVPRTLLSGLKKDQVLLLENLRFDPDEICNGQGLTAALSSYIDIYINDAFGSSHRTHASIVGLPKRVKDRGMGFLIKKEIEMLDQVLSECKSPYIAILGGAKVSDKIVVIDKLIDKVDSFIIGGAMAYTFLAAQGVAVGKSFVDHEQISFAKHLFKRIEARKKRIYLPLDHKVSSSLENRDSIIQTKFSSIPNNMMALDIGEKTIKSFSNVISTAQTIFWNGPMGVFEVPEFSEGTFAIARAVSQNEGLSIVGGGDSASAAYASGTADQITHISTGGGASLEYLQGIELPGLEALKPLKQSESPSEGTMV